MCDDDRGEVGGSESPFRELFSDCLARGQFGIVK
jgi:hypothetical protein